MIYHKMFVLNKDVFYGQLNKRATSQKYEKY